MFENAADTLDSRKNSLAASVGVANLMQGKLGKVGLGDNPIIVTLIKSDSILHSQF